MKVCVLVLGDIGRSPRMQYHSDQLSELKSISEIHLVGYSGTSCFNSISSNSKITLSYLPQIESQFIISLKTKFYLIYAFYKIFFDLCSLFIVLSSILPSCDILLLQNPPSLPLFFLCYVFKFFLNIKIIIDWHNLTYSLIKTKNKTIQAAVKIYELYFGYLIGSQHFVVSQEMKQFLIKESYIKSKKIIVLYDRPFKHFKPLTLEEKHDCLVKLSHLFTKDQGQSKTTETILTRKQNESISMKHRRPLVIVSSTSYTEDEDFSILLQALSLCDKYCKQSSSSPSIICLVTGKGPLKEYYRTEIDKLNFEFVNIRQIWLESEDYPKILGCSDLGICLHTSSSGIDLPMKIIDMFGVGIPVCAYKYRTIHELVKDKQNGLLFKDSQELSQQLISFLRERDEEKEENGLLNKLKQGVSQSREHDWNKEWNTKVKACFTEEQQTQKSSRRAIFLLFSITIALMLILLVKITEK